MASLIITLDGPAGSGKSAVARLLAKRLGFAFLDTGAMYRGVMAVCLDRGIDPVAAPQSAASLADSLDLRFDWETDPPELYLHTGDECINLTGRLRDAEVTRDVSAIAAIPGVRQVLVQAQQRISQTHRQLVSEGRDQGSVVFPDAAMKFYLDAAPRVRARRRSRQLQQAGQPANEKQILHAISQRDERDAKRSEGPLMCPDDALHVDTSDMTLDQVVDFLERCVNNK